jgi:hypothetical protein
MHGPVRVPEQAAKGMAEVTLSFPDWKEGSVRPVTLCVPVVDPESNRKK